MRACSNPCVLACAYVHAYVYVFKHCMCSVCVRVCLLHVSTYLGVALLHGDCGAGSRRPLCLEAVRLRMVCLIAERGEEQYVVLRVHATNG